MLIAGNIDPVYLLKNLCPPSSLFPQRICTIVCKYNSTKERADKITRPSLRDFCGRDDNPL
jgi:hypothetical protein